MADEDDAELDVGSDEEDLKIEKKKKDDAPKAGTPHMALRVILGAAGLLLLVGFFLEWLKLDGPDGGVDAVSGLELVMANHHVVRAFLGEENTRFVLLLVPTFGVALTAVGFLGIRYSGQIAAVLGVLIVGSGVATIVILFFQKTGYGLWMVLGGAFVAVLAGMITFIRQRRAPEPTKPKD